MTATFPGPPGGPSRPRGCLATLAVLVVMLGIVGAGFAAASAVADIPDRPVTVADGVVVTPATGWELGGRSDDGTGILLSNGAGSLFISVAAGSREPRDALAALLIEWRAQGGSQITTGELGSLDIRPGTPAARFSYTGTFEGIGYPVEGDVTAVQGARATVLFDGWAGLGDYALIRPDVDRMIGQATVP